MLKSKYDELQTLVDPQLKAQWESEQKLLKAQIIEANHVSESPKVVAGVDITFSMVKPDIAVCSVFILDAKKQVLGCVNSINRIDVPYMPGFLAFREAEPLKRLIDKYIEKQRAENPEFGIDVIFVDGNGILHPNHCGLASHLGVLTGIPTIGCAKKIFAIDGLNRSLTDEIKLRFKEMKGKTGFEYLKGDSGRIWGAAVKNSPEAYDPLIVSIGHKVDIDTAAQLTIDLSNSRVVEPVRLADKQSRLLIGLFDKYHEENKAEQELSEMLSSFQKIIDDKYNKLQTLYI